MTTMLASAFRRLKELSFPEFAESDELADWQADLVELDAHVAGIAITILAGRRAGFGAADLATIHTYIDTLHQRLESLQYIPADDHGIVVECKNYLAAIDEVVQSMREP